VTTPDFTQKVRGYRQFNLVDGELQSLNAQSVWMPGRNKARCERRMLGVHEWMMSYAAPSPTPPKPPRHAAPQGDCHCGLYAYHETPEEWQDGTLKQSVGAVVLAWGKVEVHRNGFRSEYAEVVALVYDPYCGPKKLKRIEKAAKLYGARVVCVDDLAADEAIQALGEPLPESMRPEPSTPPSALGVGYKAFTFSLPSSGQTANHLYSIALGESPEREEPKAERKSMLWTTKVAIAINGALAGFCFTLAGISGSLVSVDSGVFCLAMVGLNLGFWRKSCAQD
jgi:hypothetical protein